MRSTLYLLLGASGADAVLFGNRMVVFTSAAPEGSTTGRSTTGRQTSGGRIGRQAAAGMALLARSAMGEAAASQDNLSGLTTMPYGTMPEPAMFGVCQANDPNCTEPSDKEEALKEEVQNAQALVEELGKSAQMLEVKITNLPQVGLPLGAFVGLLTAEQRNEIIKAIEAKNPIAALDDLTKDTDDASPFAKMVPGFTQMVETLKDIDTSAQQVQADLTPLKAEMPKLKALYEDYVQNDKSDGSLGVLLDQYKTLNAKVMLDAVAVETTMKTAVVSLLQCVKTTIKTRTFDEKDWDAFMTNAKGAITDAFSYKGDIVALQNKMKEIELKIEDIVEPGMMEVDEVN